MGIQVAAEDPNILAATGTWSVPSGTEVLDGLCPLSRVPEDYNHIFFICPSARFMWSCLREAVGGSWFHNNLPEMFTEVLRSHNAAARPALWVIIRALLWMLWTTCNKLVIEHVIPVRATDAVFKLCGFIQLWRLLSRRSVWPSIDSAAAVLRVIAVCMRPSSSQP